MFCASMNREAAERTPSNASPPSPAGRQEGDHGRTVVMSISCETCGGCEYVCAEAYNAELSRLREENARLKDEGPGTPRGRVEWIHDFAEREFGHARHSSRSPELTIEEGVSRLRSLMSQEGQTALARRIVHDVLSHHILLSDSPFRKALFALIEQAIAEHFDGAGK
jgi:hypothetical protein